MADDKEEQRQADLAKTKEAQREYYKTKAAQKVVNRAMQDKGYPERKS